MQKEFDLKTFKKAASNVSGFLKDKNVQVQQVTLYNALSLFLGHKNWNTLKAKLEESHASIVEDSIVDEQKDVLSFNYRVEQFVKFMEKTEPNYIGRYYDYSTALETAQKLLNENTIDFDLTQHENKSVANAIFSTGVSMGDEKTYSIKIAQKGKGWFSFLDVLVFVYMVDNKWFENYIMGSCKYNYIYDSKSEKQVVNLLLPIDNFMIDRFDNELEEMKRFVTIFAEGLASVRVDIDKYFDDKGYNTVTMMANSFSGSASSMSGSAKSPSINNAIQNAGNRGRY